MPIWEDSEVANASNAVDTCRGVPAEAWADAVCAAVGRGWLLSVGGSRDGFSVSLGVIVDGKSERKYHVSAESLERALGAVLRAADAHEQPSITNGKAKA